MNQPPDLQDLQESIRDRSAFTRLDDYLLICQAFLSYVHRVSLTCIISPTHHNYIFYQYGEEHGYKVTRPLNKDLLLSSTDEFVPAFERFVDFLSALKRYQEAIVDREVGRSYIESGELDKVVYTVQQAIGSISDSFDNTNQSRKRAGQLFENLVKLIIQEVGMECEPRTVSVPIPDFPGHRMSYQLDLVFSRNKAIFTSENVPVHESEIVGSVKTTSKDRIDKVFLDKYLLSQLLGRDISAVAIFLHDVQRARRGNSIFGINSTFKTNHFLGYSVALNKLDGVYYVDPRPEMITNEQLREQISDFQRFLIKDLWTLSKA